MITSKHQVKELISNNTVRQMLPSSLTVAIKPMEKKIPSFSYDEPDKNEQAQIRKP